MTLCTYNSRETFDLALEAEETSRRLLSPHARVWRKRRLSADTVSQPFFLLMQWMLVSVVHIPVLH